MPFVFHHRDTVALGTRHVLVNHDVLKLARSARSQELNAITRQAGPDEETWSQHLGVAEGVEGATYRQQPVNLGSVWHREH
jgi:hypothetical protein